MASHASDHASATESPGPTPTGGANNNSHNSSPFRAYILWQRAEYPTRVWYYVAAGIAVFVLAYLGRLISTYRRKSKLLRATGQTQASTPLTGKSSWRRLPAAIASGYRIAAYRFTIPFGGNYVLSLTELLASAFYLAVVFSWSFVNSNGGSKEFWANRTGAIAFKQIPLLPLLAGKNNLVGLVTGLDYQRVNIMHRIVGRASFVLIMCHAFSKAPNYTAERLAQEKYLTGTLAAVAFGAIFLFSLRPVRDHAFEFFLILHICLVGIYLAGAYIHQPKHALYIWLAVGFWLLDRVLRVLKLFFLNTGKPESATATVENVAKNAIRLTLKGRNRVKWQPGQHVFLTLPTISRLPFEAHPFTVANIRNSDTNGEQDLVFIIRPMDGFTRRLHDYGLAQPEKPITVLADGPYGTSPPVNTFSTVILLAGGSGVSYTLPLLLSVVKEVREGKSPVKRVVFVWSIKRRDEFNWALPELKAVVKDIPAGLSVQIRVHVTGATDLVPSLTDSPASPVSEIDEEKRSTSLSKEPYASSEGHATEKVTPAVNGIEFLPGRADLQALVQEEAEASQGPVSVNAAGPRPLTTAIRKLLCSKFVGPTAVLKGAQPVSLFMENFGSVKVQ